MDDSTVWRVHPIYNLYEASNDGRIRSLGRYGRVRGGGSYWRPGRELRTFVRPNGYLGSNISVDGLRINFELHRFVCEAFHGLAPSDDLEARHKNGNQLDNRPDNLAWSTRSQNMQDKLLHGTHHEANKTHCRHGHEYTPDNIYRKPNAPNKRECRTCIRLRDAARARVRRQIRGR